MEKAWRPQEMFVYSWGNNKEIKVMKKINVNVENSRRVNGRLFITGLKLSQLSNALNDFIVRGSTIVHPTLGTMYEYTGPYSRR